MKKSQTEAERSHIREAAFEILTEASGTVLPDMETLLLDLYPSGKIRSADKKRLEEAIALLNDAAAKSALLNAELSAKVPQVLLDRLDTLIQKLLQIALYEVMEMRFEPEEVFKSYLQLFKAWASAQQPVLAKTGLTIQDLEKALFLALFAPAQFMLWRLLQNLMPGKENIQASVLKQVQKLGYDESYPIAGFVEPVLKGILAQEDFLDSGLERFFRKKQWMSLPEAYRNVLRIGLFESLIGLASPDPIISSLHNLMTSVEEEEQSDARARQITEKFLHSQMEKSVRSLGRALAFQIIYSLAFSDIQTEEELRKAYQISPFNISRSGAEAFSSVYSWKLLQGVWKNAESLDDIVNRFSHKWRIERMGKIEITLLRLALYEMIFMRIPARIVISEIMNIADMFGASEAKNLVNGILDAVSKSEEFHLMN